MATILKGLPYADRDTSLRMGTESVRIKPYQIIVWLSVTHPDQAHWDPRTPVFPALFDTGTNHNLSIGTDRLVRWAGFRPEHLPFLRPVWEREQRCLVYDALLWLHPNVPGTRDFAGGEPYRLPVDGIIIYPEDSPRPPRLPLLGLRALTRSKLRALIDGRRQQVSISTRPRWWPFG